MRPRVLLVDVDRRRWAKVRSFPDEIMFGCRRIVVKKLHLAVLGTLSKDVRC